MKAVRKPSEGEGEDSELATCCVRGIAHRRAHARNSRRASGSSQSSPLRRPWTTGSTSPIPTAGRAMTLGSHQTSIGKTQVHITPRWIIEVLGPFDLDPAAADPRPWDCAAVNYTERDDGLQQPWFGRLFFNPPFDRSVVPSGSASSPDTAAALHCCMPAPRPIGSSRSGRAPRRSCSWPIGCLSIDQTAHVSPRTAARRPSSSRSVAMTPSG